MGMAVRSVLAVLLLVLATGYAQKRCCYPDQFVSSEGVSTAFSREGREGISTENSSVAFDHTNGRMARIGSRFEGQRSIEFKVIYDWKEKVEYRIEPMRRHCEKHRFDEGPMPHCVSERATYLSSMYLGDRKLNVDSFLVSFKTEERMAQGSQTVTQGDCIPSSFLMVGSEDRMTYQYFSLTGFYDYVKGIKDPAKYFSVPEFCPREFSETRTMSDKIPNMLLMP